MKTRPLLSHLPHPNHFRFMLTQTTVLLMQRRYGASFFIPEIFRAEHYDYHRQIPEDVILRETNVEDDVLERHQNLIVMNCESEEEEEEDCDVHVDFEEEKENTNRSLSPGRRSREGGAYCTICMSNIDLGTRDEFVLTPCDHIFHTKCLHQWTRIKLECPTCRHALPPL